MFFPDNSSKLYLKINTFDKYFKSPIKPISIGTEITPLPPFEMESEIVLIDLSISITCSRVSKQETFSYSPGLSP